MCLFKTVCINSTIKIHLFDVKYTMMYYLSPDSLEHTIFAQNIGDYLLLIYNVKLQINQTNDSPPHKII